MAVMPEKPQMKGQKDFPKVQMVATNFKSFISTARSSKLTLPFTEEKPSQGKVWPEKLNKGCTVLCWSRRRRTAGPASASDALHSHERRSWRVKPLLIYPHDTWWSPWQSHRQWLTGVAASRSKAVSRSRMVSSVTGNHVWTDVNKPSKALPLRYSTCHQSKVLKCNLPSFL